MKVQPVFSQPGQPLPDVPAPFAVLLDAEDEDWRNPSTLYHHVLALLEAGCRYFVCCGDRCEALHDAVDDVVVERGYEGVMTTFHEGEPHVDVVAFFRLVSHPMKGALVLA